MNGEWLRKPQSRTTVVFLHGVLSSGKSCWTNRNGTYWPDLVRAEREFEHVGIYVYTYETGLFSGRYSLNNIVDDLKERLLTLDGVLESERIVFVCHSMGGIVARKFLVERAYDLVDRNNQVGLFLVASPSLGAAYANWLRPLARLLGHSQAVSLRFAQDNDWLNDLDKQFQNLKESHRFPIHGKELIEDKSVFLRTFFRRQVVEPFTGARYFGEPYKVPNSDHFTIAKPEHKESIQHRLLIHFLRQVISDEVFLRNTETRKSDRDIIDDYGACLASQPLISGYLFNGDYQIAPSDLLRIEMREIDFRSGDPVRAIRTSKILRFDDLIQEAAHARVATSTKIIVILGDAGVGKTIHCKWLCRHLAQRIPELGIVPIYVPLGEMDAKLGFSLLLDQQVRTVTFLELAGAVAATRLRLIFFLDGWNEQETERLRDLRAFLQNGGFLKNAIVVLTSRPVTSVDTMWEGESVRFYEILRWTDEQLEQYFVLNGQDHLLSQVPKEAIHCLRLPLLAFLLMKRLDKDEPPPSLRTIADVFGYVLGHFLVSNKKKSRAIPKLLTMLDERQEAYLQKLAYQMTKGKVIQVLGAFLENLMSDSDKPQFKEFLASQVNSGLLRSSNAIVAIDPSADIDEVRKLKIAFLHQAFQEYLAAQWLLSSGAHSLPPDVSHDAFWREVPVYMIQSKAPRVDQQKRFALGFIQDNPPDYLTSARLAQEILDPGVRRAAQEQIMEKLNSNIRDAGVYAYAIETISTLGIAGQDLLHGNLANVRSWDEVFARAEAHLLHAPPEGAQEEEWRALGRSIYILGELGDFWLARHLAQHIDSVCSLHLLYHIGEALLTLSRMPNLSPEHRSTIAEAGLRLDKHSRSDAVVRGYTLAIARICGGRTLQGNEAAIELTEFLRLQTDAARPNFREEFWRRAHGSEALAEVAASSISVDVLLRLFQTENEANYGDYRDGNYSQVQSSIIKAVRRSCDLYPGSETFQDWRRLLETLFQSGRISANDWACRHLERLLLKWFNGQEELVWIKQWKDSERLGGPRIAAVLSNVIWMSS